MKTEFKVVNLITCKWQLNMTGYIAETYLPNLHFISFNDHSFCMSVELNRKKKLLTSLLVIRDSTFVDCRALFLQHYARKDESTYTE